MSGVTPEPEAACLTGVTLTDPTMCKVLNDAKMEDLAGPSITAPTPVTDEFMPARLKQAMADCIGTSSCKFIGYDFDTNEPTKASASRYVVDTYSTTVENSSVLVLKGKKTSGTVSGVTADAATGGSTGTVTYTADNGQTYTFQGRWRTLQTNTASVDVYFDPANMSRGALRPEDLGFAPPTLVEPPGYELPDFQAASTTGTNLINSSVVSSVEECAKKCDDETQCTGFNVGGLDTSSICELVKSTTTRAYVDGMSGFRKENIPNTRVGSDVPGTDITNQGAYCRDAQACNTDIDRIITENEGAINKIVSLSTSDIASCAYCPIRSYNRTGVPGILGIPQQHVTTNEFGVSKSNQSAGDAISELQYQSDGTFAGHLTIEPGKFYKFGSIVVFTVADGDQFKLFTMSSQIQGPSTFEVPIFGFFTSNLVPLLTERPLAYQYNKGNLVVDGTATDTGSTQTNYILGLIKNFSFQKIPVLGMSEGKADTFTFIPVPFLTNGFRIVSLDGRAIINRTTKGQYTLFSKDSVFQVSESNHYEFVNQLSSYIGPYPNFPGIMFKDGYQYVKLNSNGTAELVQTGQYPWTSRYSSSFRFCKNYYAVSFDLDSFDWNENWFTQTGAATCEKYVDMVYTYQYALSVFDAPGFWNGITKICSINNCPAGKYTADCTSNTPTVRQCTTCSTGSYCPQFANSEETCPPGYYCPTPASKRQCGTSRSCPSGYAAQGVPGGGCLGTHSSTNNRTVDTSYTCVFQSCPANNILVGSSCQPCLNGGTSVGTESSCFCINGWSGARCDTCSANRYISGSSCLSCPAYSSSSQNSTRCLCNYGHAWTGANYTLGNILWAFTFEPISGTGGSILLSRPSIPGVGTNYTYSTPYATTTGTSALCTICKEEYWDTLCNGTAPAEGLTKTCGIGRNQCVSCPAGQGIGPQGTCWTCGIANPPLGQVWKSDPLVGGYLCDYDQCPIPPQGYIWATNSTTCSQQVCSMTPAPGYIWANDGINCTMACPADYYCPDASTKTKCPAGYTSGGGPQTVLSRPATSVADCFPCLGYGTICRTCPNSTPYFNLGLNRCVYCFFNSECTGTKRCIQGTCQCPEYAPYDTGTNCVQCTTNSHCPNGSCVNNICQVDAYSYSCPDTQVRYQTPAPAGMLGVSLNKTVSLIDSRCRTNEVTPLTGTCLYGVTSNLKYDLLDGQCSMPALVTCRAGYYATTDWRGAYNQCVPCMAGFYCPTTGLTQQYQCPAGTYCPDGRIITPLGCPAGFYCPTALTTTPTLCPVDSYSAEGSTTCNCPSNYEWNGSACYMCPVGSTAPGRTASGTMAFCLCPVNNRWNGSACVACGPNTYRDRQSSASGTESYCTCTPGYKWSGTACVTCPANSSISMTVVAVGSEKYCTCATNYRWNSTACVACPANATSSGLEASGSAKYCTCATNYRWNGSECVACPANSTSSGLTASGSANYCTCDSGFSASTPGSPCILSCYGEGLADRSMPCCPGLFYDDGRCSS